MNPEYGLKISHLFILIGAILAAIGGFGNFYFKSEIEKINRAKEEAQRIIQSIPKLHFHQIKAYYVNQSGKYYKLGTIVQILNKDATRAFVVEGIGYQGGMTFGGEKSGSFNLKNVIWQEGMGRVSGKYFLKPGDETSVKFLIPHTVEMTIVGGIPGVSFTGKWVVFVEGTAFEVKPDEIIIENIITREEWDRL